MNWKKAIFDYKGNVGAVWLWIGIILLVLNFVVVGTARWEFWYGLTYSLGLLGLGIILSVPKPALFAALFAALGGTLSVVLNLNAFPVLTAEIAATLGIIFFIAMLVIEAGLLKIGGRKPEARYLTLMAFGAIGLFGLMYLYNRYTMGIELNFETILYHGGITALAGIDLVSVVGKYNFGGRRTKLRLILALVAILGAALTTGLLGWGLTLT